MVVLITPMVVGNIAQYLFSRGRSGESQNAVISSIYVGDWQDESNPANVIRILPSGSASCRIVQGIMHYTVSGGRASLDKGTLRLAIKFNSFGPTWHVDEPPHETTAGAAMKLDGRTFRKSRSYPLPSGSNGSSGI